MSDTATQARTLPRGGPSAPPLSPTMIVGADTPVMADDHVGAALDLLEAQPGTVRTASGSAPTRHAQRPRTGRHRNEGGV